VDLTGYTQHSRSQLLGLRPAPVQVNFLGYPGTMGADYIDYVIADPITLPWDQQPFYAERIVHLPDCYQVSDRKRPMPGAPRGGAARAWFRVLLLQPQPQDHPAGVRDLDAALGQGAWIRALAPWRPYRGRA
jgi:hypothetical protein